MVGSEMMSSPGAMVGSPEFNGAVELDGRGVIVRFSGVAETKFALELARLVNSAQAAVEQNGLRHVTLDFRALEFMSSSCFKLFVTWLSRIGELPRDRQYELQLLTDKTRLWQRRAFAALACFAAGRLSIAAD
jgi:hypothetical protein